MTTRPILFSAPMVRAILDGRKTVTRRVLTVGRGLIPTEAEPYGADWDDEGISVRVAGGHREKLDHRFCPFGMPGDRLWARETWGLFDTQPKDGPKGAHVFYRATDGDRHDLRFQLWRPSIFMPRWASRLTLEVTGVRVERLQDLTEDDARAEGLSYAEHVSVKTLGDPPVGKWGVDGFGWAPTAREAFALGWDKLNGKRAPWASNCHVWRVAFRRVS